jgi:CheY-like chemotaxis protein
VDGSQLAGRTILVVEDEPLVALEMADALTACGAHVVSASRVADALSSVALHNFAAAVLDINLGNSDCAAICQYLRERGIPFLFYTGYSTPLDGFCDILVVPKPAASQKIIDPVERLCGSHQKVA